MTSVSPNYYTYSRKELYPYIPQQLSKTLDIGCATGVFSEHIKQKFNAEVWGVEMHKESANIAEGKLDKVLIGMFDEVKDKLPIGYFDCVFFNDVLEHMMYPNECLIDVRKNIAPDGVVLASIPNVRNVAVLRELVFGKDFKYQDSGIMDKTHLRFFTKKSIIRMFEQCGYTIETIAGINPIGKYCFTSILNKILFNYIDDIRYTQFVIVAKPKK